MSPSRVLASRLALLGFALSGGCTALPELTANQCGNHIIEVGEDCDGAGVGDNTCNATCRLECTSKGACPDGWGCGTDGLCRQPTGTVAPFGDAVSLPAETLRLADFDGDGRSDLIATQASSVSIAFVDSGGLLPGTTNFDFAPVDMYPDIPGVGDLDGDARSDLVVRVGGGLGLLTGQHDQTFLPKPFLRQPPKGAMPNDELIIADIDPRPSSPGPEILAVRTDGIYLITSAATDMKLPVKMYGWEDGTVPSVSVGRVFSSNYTAGLNLVVARDGDSFINVYEPFISYFSPNQVTVPNFDGSTDAHYRPPMKITLPSGGTVMGPTMIGQLYPSSGLPDLVIRGFMDGKPQLFASFNENQQLGLAFNSTPSIGQINGVNAADQRASKFDRTVDGKPEPDLPYAIGFFGSKTSFGGFVDQDGVHVPDCDASCTSAFVVGPPAAELTLNYTTSVVPSSPGGWTSAYVVETQEQIAQGAFASPDIVAVSPNSGFTYLKRNGDLYSAFHFATQSEITDLAVGDFNGDGATDLVFAQGSKRATPKNPGLQSMHIAFGDAFDLPTDPVDLGDVGRIDRLFTSRVALGKALPQAIDDIFARDNVSGNYYVFRGSTDRLIQSTLELPLVCTDDAVEPVGIPRVTAIGRFDDPEKTSLAVLFEDQTASDPTWALWSLHPDSSQSEDDCKTLVGPTTVDSPNSANLQLLPIDLGNAGGEETLAILPTGDQQIFFAQYAKGGWKMLDPVKLDSPVRGMSKSNLGVAAPGSSAKKTGEDLMVWTDDGVTVVWNDGSGALSSKNLSSITTNGVSCPARGNARVGAPNGVGALHLQPTVERSLVVVSDQDTLYLSVDPKTRKLSVQSCVTDIFQGGGTAITTGDIDGDGVEDIVLARMGGTRVFSGVPVVR